MRARCRPAAPGTRHPRGTRPAPAREPQPHRMSIAIAAPARHQPKQHHQHQQHRQHRHQHRRPAGRVGRAMAAATAAAEEAGTSGRRRVQLRAVDVTPENFRPFGQVGRVWGGRVGATEWGGVCGGGGHCVAARCPSRSTTRSPLAAPPTPPHAHARALNSSSAPLTTASNLTERTRSWCWTAARPGGVGGWVLWQGGRGSGAGRGAGRSGTWCHQCCSASPSPPPTHPPTHPRFYIMQLPRRGRTFHRITYHADVTQCLGGLDPPQPWCAWGGDRGAPCIAGVGWCMGRGGRRGASHPPPVAPLPTPLKQTPTSTPPPQVHGCGGTHSERGCLPSAGGPGCVQGAAWGVPAHAPGHLARRWALGWGGWAGDGMGGQRRAR